MYKVLPVLGEVKRRKTMSDNEMPATKTNRIHWMDNLRTITILLVVLYHVGGVYEAAGLWGWFWIVDDPDTITWVGIVGIMFDIMVMPIMFFIAGYLTPASLKNKTGRDFIMGKAKRLLLPWLIAVLTLIPLYKVIFLYSRNLPQEHWSTYFHVTNPNSQNWLWFLPVLFSFNMLYLLFTKLDIKLPTISLKFAIIGIFLIGLVYSFLISGILGFRSWTLTPIIDFENMIQIAIFTGGRSPAMSKKIRIQSERIFKDIITKEDIDQIKIQQIARTLAKNKIDTQVRRKSFLKNIMGDNEIKQLIKDGKRKKAENSIIAILRDWK